MGFRFSLRHANWLAHILKSTGPVPDIADDFSARESLATLLRSAGDNFFGSPENRSHLDALVQRSEKMLYGGGGPMQVVGIL
jgi:hypothetical protein